MGGGDGGRRIAYDDDAIDRLLDRSDMAAAAEAEAAAEPDEGAGDLLKAFKVANFEFAEPAEVKAAEGMVSGRKWQYVCMESGGCR